MVWSCDSERMIDSKWLFHENPLSRGSTVILFLNPCKGSLLVQENPSPALQNAGVTEKIIPKVLPSFIPIKPVEFSIQEAGEGLKVESTW